MPLRTAHASCGLAVISSDITGIAYSSCRSCTQLITKGGMFREARSQVVDPVVEDERGQPKVSTCAA
jgi:hypothetical protein